MRRLKLAAISVTCVGATASFELTCRLNPRWTQLTTIDLHSGASVIGALESKMKTSTLALIRY